MSPPSSNTGLGQRAHDVARLEGELLKWKLRHAYNPDQPRVPAGRPDGGQWTGTGASKDTPLQSEVVHEKTGQESWRKFINTYRRDGSLAEQAVLNRDGSAILSEFGPPDGSAGWDERHTVFTSDGSKFTFENSGDVQTIRDWTGQPLSKSIWTDNGPEPLPVVQQAQFVPTGPPVKEGARFAFQKGVEAALALFAWLSSRNGPDRQAVLAFTAREFRPYKTAEGSELAYVGSLTRDKVEAACRRLDDVQKMTDSAADIVKQQGNYRDPADYGTKVHLELKKKVDAEGDPDFIAETSFVNGKPANYGEKGSIRTDVLENIRERKTVCFYDIKTGQQGLGFPRTVDIAKAYKAFPGTLRVIVTEVRPSR